MLAGLGVLLLGRLTGVVDGRAVFDGSGAENVEFGNQRWSVTRELIDAYIAAHGLDAASYQEDEGGDDVRFELDRLPSPRGGRRLDGDLVHRLHRRPQLPGPAGACMSPARSARQGSASEVPGLWFAGFPWLVERRSGIFYGFPVDAARTADQLTEHLARR